MAQNSGVVAPSLVRNQAEKMYNSTFRWGWQMGLQS